jgi:hypothetical protein
MRRSLLSLPSILFLCIALSACEGMGIGGKPSKMSGGELYQAGDAKYDPYLKKVHEEQVAAAEWAEQSKGARKPLTHALNLPPNAGNATILEAAKSKKDDAAVKSAAEETASLERSFIEKQKVNAERLDKLAADGVELKKQATEDRRNMGADKADPEKVEKKEEIKREVSSAVDIAANLRDDAKKGALEGEKLIDALKKELGIAGDGSAVAKKDDASPKKDEAPKKDEPPPKKGEGKKSDAKKPATEPKPAAKKPDPKPAAEAKPAEEKPEPKPAKKRAEKPPETEVFSP